MSSDQRDPDRIPEWADAWMAQWRNAERNLPIVRQQELRQLPPGQLISVVAPQEPEGDTSDRNRWSGLVIQQRWFMRQRLLELESLLGPKE